MDFINLSNYRTFIFLLFLSDFNFFLVKLTPMYTTITVTYIQLLISMSAMESSYYFFQLILKIYYST